MFRKVLYRAPAARFLVILGVLALFSPIASQAGVCNPGTFCIANDGGSLVGSNSGLTLSGSTVTQVGNSFGTDLGTYSFTTGALVSGNLKTGAVFASGGVIDISQGSSTLFSGSFTSQVDLTLLGSLTTKGACPTGGCIYTIAGTISGSLNGQNVSGATIQETIDMKKPWTGASVPIENGQTFFVTPEPGTLGLVGTGFVGIALGALRRLKERANGEQDVEDVTLEEG
jgi:hypothetical protein